MSNEATAVAADDAVHHSQDIQDIETHEVPRAGDLPEADAPKPVPTTREAITRALDDAEKATKAKADEAVKDAKAKVDEAEKAEKAEKAEDKPARQRSEDGKFAKAEKTEGDDADADADKGAPERGATERAGHDEQRQSEGRRHAEPPARFLPEARQKWANVPNEVKAEFHRVSQEMEGEITRHREASERYEQFRQYDEMARSNGRDFARESLPKIVQFENMMRSNPVAALDFALREAGPRKADGSPVSLYEVAQHIVQNGPQSVPQAHMQPQQKSSAPNPEIEMLRAEIQSMRAETTIVPVLQRFAAEHTDYHALEPQIEAILKSGVVEQIYGPSLSLEQKLTEAYRMAGGHAPSRSDPEPSPAHSEAPASRLVDPDGQKSIKGAPSSGQTGKPKWVPKTNREALERAFSDTR